MTLVEILLAFLLLSFLLLPVFSHLHSTVKETERFYAEAIAISRAKFIMDTSLTQIPWRCFRAGNPCRIDDPKGVPAMRQFLGEVVPRMFGEECDGAGGGSFLGNGLWKDPKGFYYRARLKCLDLPDVQFRAGNTFAAADLIPKDADGNYTVIKKLVLQIRWSLLKGKDPLTDPKAHSLFLVAFKSDLER
jgi:hypothetical protein